MRVSTRIRNGKPIGLRGLSWETRLKSSLAKEIENEGIRPEKARQSGKRKKSRGPTTPEGKQRSSHNAVQHGFSARTLIFESDEEQGRYDQLLAELRNGSKSTSTLQDFMLQQIVAGQILSERAQRWISQEMINRNSAAVAPMLDALIEKTEALQIPLPGLTSASESGGNISSGWLPWTLGDLELNLVGGEQTAEQSQQASDRGGRSHTEKEAKREGTGTTQRYELRLRLADNLERLRRYDSAIKRDLYRAIEVWQKLNK